MKMSRREVVRCAGAALALVGTNSHGLGNTALASRAKSAAAPTVTGPENKNIYQLLALWVALSTNPYFNLNDPSIIGQIQAQTGADKQIVCEAINIVTSEHSAYDGIREMFEEIAALFGSTVYTPGQCPKYISAIQPIGALKPPQDNPLPPAPGNPQINCPSSLDRQMKRRR